MRFDGYLEFIEVFDTSNALMYLIPVIRCGYSERSLQ